MLLSGEMRLTVIKNEHNRIVHNITLCGSNVSIVGIGGFFCFLFFGALGLCCCAWTFSSCGEHGEATLPCGRAGFSLQWLLLLRSTGSSCSFGALELRLSGCAQA